VEPENILVINKNKKNSKFLTNLPAVQEIINNEIGRIQNLELIRFWSSGKFLILEGDKDDVKILKIIQDKIFPKSNEPFDTIPKIFTEGWGGWQRVIGSSMTIKGIGDIKIYCIFDSDYHIDREKEERYSEAQKHNIYLHIWSKKEIENYLIVPSTIFRFIEKKHTMGNPTLKKIEDKINELSSKLKDLVIDSFASEIKKNDKQLDVKTCNTQARTIVNYSWSDIHKRLSIVPGDTMISILSGWSKDEFGVSFNKFQIAKELKTEEIDIELKKVINAIENRENL
jgi:hypothetical protein